MRKIILFLLLTCSLELHAQDMQKLTRKGDSLANIKDYKSATEMYDKCVELVLTGKEQVSDVTWSHLLITAIKINNLNKSNPVKYSRLAYSTRAEKISDKIELLKDMGVDHVFSFSIGDWQYEYFVDESSYMCPDIYNREMLVWEVNGNVFFQAFSSCITYKSLKIKDNELVNLLKNHTNNEFIKQKITRMPTKHSEIVPHDFTFYSNGVVLKTITADIVDFKDIDGDYLKFWKKESIDAAHQIYLANTKTYFSTIFSRSFVDADSYFSFINSGPERAKLGGVKTDNLKAF